MTVEDAVASAGLLSEVVFSVTALPPLIEIITGLASISFFSLFSK